MTSEPQPFKLNNMRDSRITTVRRIEMLSVNRTEENTLDCSVHDFDGNSDASGLRESLDTRFLVNPVVEAFADHNDTDLTVADAARIYRKSTRQIQRLLKSGYLAGHKIIGSKGPEWRVCRVQNGQHKEDAIQSGQTVPTVIAPSFELNAKVNIIAHDLKVLMLKAERFEAAIARIDNLASKLERLHSDVQVLKELTSHNESVVKELHMLREQQSMIEFVSTEVRNHRQVLKDLTDKQSKPSWWKNAFST